MHLWRHAKKAKRAVCKEVDLELDDDAIQKAFEFVGCDQWMVRFVCKKWNKIMKVYPEARMNWTSIKSHPDRLFSLMDSRIINNQQVLWKAVELGDYDLLDISRMRGSRATTIHLDEACLRGHTDFAENLAEEFVLPFDSYSMEVAASGGHYDTCNMIMSHVYSFDDTATLAAALGGHVKCLGLLLQYGLPLHYTVPGYCIAQNNLKLFKMVFKHAGPELPPNILRLAVELNLVEMARYILTHVPVGFMSMTCIDQNNLPMCSPEMIQMVEEVSPNQLVNLAAAEVEVFEMFYF